MGSRKYKLHDGRKGSALAVRLTPKASRNAIVGIMEDGTVKVHVTAPPVEGKANQALVKLIAEVLKVPKSSVEIVAGETGRDKLVSVINMDADTVTKRIRKHLG
ncbi:MAG: YggU family protein [Anaerolineaceae bacterium 4572_5.1]|nr:MAG: YggU family protein [Anaerolinea sp. 4484_236]OQY33730.1 MAG: YggU family protein [Anaerolineaceae bacterium 4572_5.1]